MTSATKMFLCTYKSNEMLIALQAFPCSQLINMSSEDPTWQGQLYLIILKETNSYVIPSLRKCCGVGWNKGNRHQVHEVVSLNTAALQTRKWASVHYRGVRVEMQSQRSSFMAGIFKVKLPSHLTPGVTARQVPARTSKINEEVSRSKTTLCKFEPVQTGSEHLLSLFRMPLGTGFLHGL